MGENEAFQPDWEANVATADHILNFEVEEFRLEAEFLNDSGVLASCQSGLIF